MNEWESRSVGEGGFKEEEEITGLGFCQGHKGESVPGSVDSTCEGMGE